VSEERTPPVGQPERLLSTLSGGSPPLQSLSLDEQPAVREPTRELPKRRDPSRRRVPARPGREEKPQAEEPRAALPSVCPRETAPTRRVVVLCREAPENPLWLRIRQETGALTRRGIEVDLCCPQPIEMDGQVQVHVLGSSEGDLVEQAQEFARRACAALASKIESAGVPAIAYEWGAIPAMLALGVGPRMISLESLERQRCEDLQRPLSARIDEIEASGLARAQSVIVRDPGTAEHARRLDPSCSERLTYSRGVFPAHEFSPCVDPGEVKARYQVGPTDPTVLYIGDLDWRHGPELVLRAMPPLLKNHPQARLIAAGEGELLWPLKVQSRYMLLDHAVRVVGDVSGPPARELIAAADLVIVPSRERTEDWQILAAWAAGRPVVATHQVAGHFCSHEADAVLIYPNPGSCVWGVERLLYDPGLAQRLSRRGGERLDELHGWSAVGAQLEELLFPASARAPEVSPQPPLA